MADVHPDDGLFINISEFLLGCGLVYLELNVIVPLLSKTDDVTVILKLTPLETRQMTRASFRHSVDAHAVYATRARPDQSERPALLPYTNTVICAVEG